MNANAKKWLEALRSGRFQQGHANENGLFKDEVPA